MEMFDFENLNISTASNETIAALAEALFPLTSERSEEEREIDRDFEGVLETLESSFNPKQRKWFEHYQQQMDAELRVAERRRFVCGFKTAMRLALESMK